MSRSHLLAISAMAALSVFLPLIHAQDASHKTQAEIAPQIVTGKTLEADLTQRKQRLLTQSDDLNSIMKSLNGVDFQNALSINDHADQGVTYLDATVWFVGIYNRMQCDDDKNLAKAVLQNRLGFYAHMLDMAVEQTNGDLGLTRLPAVAQQGAQIRDELRAAKAQLDAINASLK